MRYSSLNPEKALIWRIVHRDNIPWILDHGLACGNGASQCASWVSIGNAELTDKRATHPVPIEPFGHLNDYVPFYFTPFSPMLLNIKTGRGVLQRNNDDIVILVSSLPTIENLGLRYVFTDKHAYYQWANFYNDLNYLQQVDWAILQARDFKRDMNDPVKFERYQAEALVYRHCPATALLGMICYNEDTKNILDISIAERNMALQVHVRPEWYF